MACVNVSVCIRQVLLHQIFPQPPLSHFDHADDLGAPELESLGMKLKGAQCSRRAPGAPQPQQAEPGEQPRAPLEVGVQSTDPSSLASAASL